MTAPRPAAEIAQDLQSALNRYVRAEAEYRRLGDEDAAAELGGAEGAIDRLTRELKAGAPGGWISGHT